MTGESAYHNGSWVVISGHQDFRSRILFTSDLAPLFWACGDEGLGWW